LQRVYVKVDCTSRHLEIIISFKCFCD